MLLLCLLSLLSLFIHLFCLSSTFCSLCLWQTAWWISAGKELYALLALFLAAWWTSAGKELSSWLCFWQPGGHLLGKSCPLGFCAVYTYCRPWWVFWGQDIEFDYIDSWSFPFHLLQKTVNRTKNYECLQNQTSRKTENQQGKHSENWALWDKKLGPKNRWICNGINSNWNLFFPNTKWSQ